jgi:hypothetical protein
MDEMYSLFRWFGEWLAVIEWTHVINRGSALLFLLGLGFGMGRFSVDQKRGPIWGFILGPVFFLFTGALLFGLTEFFFFVMDHKLQP